MTFMKSRLIALVAAGLLLTCGAASADTKLRVGKAQPNQFAFVPADIRVEAGSFKKRVATEGYSDTMPIFSTTGHFEPIARDVLAASFVEIKLLPEKPDMSKLIIEAYLPK